MIPLLRERGHEAVALDLPAEGAADTVAASVAGHDDVIVVAHSFGGFVAGPAAERIGARLIVLVSAMVPEAGETAGGWWETSGFSAEVDADFDDEHALYFHDISPELEAEAMRHARDVAAGADAPFPGWPDIPVKVLAFEEDRLFPVAFQTRVARERLGAEVETLPGGHYGAISRPEALAERLHALAG